MWAETTTKGHEYYREQADTRAYMGCAAQGKVIRLDRVDEQMGDLKRNLSLEPTWKRPVLAHLAVTRERQQVQEKLKRLGKVYVDRLRKPLPKMSRTTCSRD